MLKNFDYNVLIYKAEFWVVVDKGTKLDVSNDQKWTTKYSVMDCENGGSHESEYIIINCQKILPSTLAKDLHFESDKPGLQNPISSENVFIV